MYHNLTKKNFLLFAAKHYISPHYIEEEFFTDLQRIKYIKRLIQKYYNSGELRERLLLNHIILTYNVFETEACTKMLFLHIHKSNFPALKTILIYLDFMPNEIHGVDGENIYSSDIQIDFNIANRLRVL